MNSLSILYQNVRGLRSKLPIVYSSSVDCDFNVIVFTESWLSSDINDSEILCSDYQVFRNDRYSGIEGTRKKGGGVLIAVHNSISSDNFQVSIPVSIEIICVRLIFKNCLVYVTCSYIPPNSPMEIYSQHAELIGNVASNLGPNDSLVVLGDFNLPTITWSFCDDVGR